MFSESCPKFGTILALIWDIITLVQRTISIYQSLVSHKGYHMENSSVHMAAKDERPRISQLGEWYEDLLTVDSAINGRSQAQQAASLLCAKLQERELRIKERVRYLAAKRGISFDTMWVQLLKGEYEKLTPEELKDLDKLSGDWSSPPETRGGKYDK